MDEGVEHSVNWKRNTISCLDTAVREVQNSEQTQEIKLSDGMPDVGKILSAWGQPILRGKEWESGRMTVSAGMMVWVLYAPEDGSKERCLDAWVPFQLRWDLPEGTEEGDIRIRCLPRFVDARSVSPRKIMVRCAMGCLGEAFVPKTVETFSAEDSGDEVQLLQSTYPARLYKEAGEKSFLVDEELTVPDSLPQPEEVLYYRMNPQVTEKKVLGNKVVFRGNGNLHVLYRGEEGRLQSWDFELPFSQFAELRNDHGPDALADMVLSPTNLELNLDEEGRIRFQGSVAAQYVITDKALLSLIEDAYSPGRELELQTGELELPLVLENRRENLYGEQNIPQEARSAVDTSFLPDFPRQRRGEDMVELTAPGTFQVLYYGEDGVLHSGTARWEGIQRLPADENSDLTAVPVPMDANAMTGNGQIVVKAEVPLELTATTSQRIPMVTGVNLGNPVEPDPDRPSMILRRAGDRRLWDIAKENGSTMEAIRRANGIQEEPEPDRMLLIPVP